MPGDLRDPEQSMQWHYDPKYDNPQTTNTSDGFDLNAYIQSISEEVLGKRIDQKAVDKIVADLETTGFMHRHPGDEGFRNRIKALLMAGKVVATWLT